LISRIESSVSRPFMVAASGNSPNLAGIFCRYLFCASPGGVLRG
jgi:hypothetical protein